MRRYLRSVLPSSHRISEARDGEEALKLATGTLPDLILSDVMMPDLNGLELTRAIRDDPRTTAIPVILLSARAGPEARVSGLSTGADDYLTKPFSPAELVARVTTHLQLGRTRNELDRRVIERTAALTLTERRLEHISSLVAVGIWAASADAIVHCNRAWKELTGLPEGATLVDWQRKIAPSDREAFKAALERTIRDGEVSTLDFRWLQEDQWARLDSRPHRDPTEHAFIATGTITDISYAKRLERIAIEGAESRAAESERMRKLQELSIDVSSHELRNPLSGIMANAELMVESQARLQHILRGARLDSLLPPDVVIKLEQELRGNIESTESVLICARHQRRLADDILSFSKVSLGMFQLVQAPFSPVALVRSALRMVEAEAAQRGVHVGFVIDPSITALKVDGVMADEQRLSQVVLNLVGNALRFTSSQPSTKSPSIDVILRASLEMPALAPLALRVVPADPSAAPTDSIWLTVAVADQGPGIDAKEQGKLCQKFSQVNPQIDSLTGFGLGLFVSRRIIELHHGVIDVLSHVGVGSTFTFSVPLVRSDVPMPLTVLPSTAIRPLTAHRTISAPAELLHIAPPAAARDKPATILCVDDSNVNIKVMTRQLGQRGFLTRTALNGLIALQALGADNVATADSGAGDIDAVLMDIEMPVMDGLTAIKRLREAERVHSARQRMPVIACTANARQEQTAQCLRAGFDAVIVKPYRITELLDELSSLLAQRPPSNGHASGVS